MHTIECNYYPEISNQQDVLFVGLILFLFNKNCLLQQNSVFTSYWKRKQRLSSCMYVSEQLNLRWPILQQIFFPRNQENRHGEHCCVHQRDSNETDKNGTKELNLIGIFQLLSLYTEVTGI